MSEKNIKDTKTIIIDEDSGYWEEDWTTFHKCFNCQETAIRRNDNYCSNCGVKIEWIRMDKYITKEIIHPRPYFYMKQLMYK